MTEGIGFLCGLTMRWFRDAFCEREKEIATREGVDAYYLLEKQAEDVEPGSNGVIPIFSDIMNARRWIHASPSFVQFDINRPQASGKKECVRAIEESAAYVALGHLQILQAITRRKIKRVVFCGGGIERLPVAPNIIRRVRNHGKRSNNQRIYSPGRGNLRRSRRRNIPEPERDGEGPGQMGANLRTQSDHP